MGKGDIEIRRLLALFVAIFCPFTGSWVSRCAWGEKVSGLLFGKAKSQKINLTPFPALLDGTRKNPGDRYLRKLGLRRVTYIEEI